MENNFHVRWMTGNISVNAERYFSSMGMPSIKKLLKLACQHCTEDDRKKLLVLLEEAVENHDLAMKTAEDLRQQSDALFAERIRGYVNRPKSTPEKQLKKQHQKLLNVIKIVKGQKWLAFVKEQEWLP